MILDIAEQIGALAALALFLGAIFVITGVI